MTATTSSGNRPSLFSITIQDPAHPTIIDSYITYDSLTSLALVADTYLYVVGDSNEMLVFDVSDPYNLQLLTTVAIEEEGLR